MTRIFGVVFLSLFFFSCKQKGGNAGIELKNIADSAGYALGVNLATNLKSDNMAGLNFALVSVAMEEMLSGKEPRISIQECGSVLQQYNMLVMTDSAAAKAKSDSKAKMENGNPKFESLADSAGYALGVNIGSTLKMQGLTDLNRTYMDRAIKLTLAGDSLLIKPDACVDILNSYMTEKNRAKSEVVIKEGEDFLAKNGQRPEVKTTASGLQYEILREGKGAKPTINDVFVAHFQGTLLDGTEFDGSYTRGEPLEMLVNQMITGWIEGLQLMPIGSKYKFYVPYQLGYGLQGRPPAIPGGAALIFEIELLDVKKI